ncbi:hypothetical protein [Rhodoferax sp. PAMC 29310]|uniref:hypothetical protein n=1 Tax=Rhodoferax sp. PAMC 29310 TaxID=2822760 RepID=UPI001B3262E8|nr:hypothetical protein [Rhodoferax sp. PAMC 29310]
MKIVLSLLIIVAQAATVSIAATEHGDKEREVDIARHQAMASAHNNAAKCLASGEKENVCEQALQAACRGLAIGKTCGMKHAH